MFIFYMDLIRVQSLFDTRASTNLFFRPKPIPVFESENILITIYAI